MVFHFINSTKKDISRAINIIEVIIQVSKNQTVIRRVKNNSQ